MKTEFLVYLLEVSGCMGAFFFLYQLLLRNQTAFTFNRIFILAAVGLSLVLPSAEFPAPETPLPTVMISLEALVVAPAAIAEPDAFDWWGAALYPYLGGVVLFTCLFLYRLYSLWQLARQFSTEEYEGFVLIRTEGQLPTFSFFRWLFWNDQENLTEAQQEQILRHEETHIRQRHSVDILLLEVVKIACWFNPFIYLFQNTLRTVHEYLADREAVQTSSPVEYMRLVAAQTLQRLSFSFTQPFHSFQLKKRIAMIKAAHTQPPVFWRIAASVVIVSLFSFLYACRSAEDIDITKDEVLSSAEKMPSYEYGFEGLYSELNRNMAYPVRLSSKDIINSKGAVSFVITKDGKMTDVKVINSVHEALDQQIEEAFSKVEGKWNPGIQNGRPENIRMTVALSFVSNGQGGIALSAPRSQQESLVAQIRVPPPPPQTPNEKGVFQVVEQMPQFEGETPGLFSYLQNNLKYPAEARANNIQGTVFVSFVVDADGAVSDVHVLKGIGAGCDAEAVRVVKNMPKWEPGKQSGKPVAVRYALPIKFSLGE